MPGHTTDSIAILVTDDGSLLTGDTVLGRGTTVIAWPDGVLGPYLDSLARIRELVLEGAAVRFLPGHGPVVEDPLPVIDYYLEHRAERLDQVRAARGRRRHDAARGRRAWSTPTSASTSGRPPK